MIFESLNSTGVALSEGDKIRNFILMGLPAKEQNDFYERYWNKIEICTNYDVSSFVRDYLSVKQQAIPSQSKVYFTFKAYVEESRFATEDLLKELLFYARLYEILLKGKMQDKQINSCIYRLNRLETTITRPFFLEVLRLHAEEKLTVEEVRDIFLTTENYLFRRTICDLPTNALNKIFLLLHREIIRYDEKDTDYTAKFKYALLSKKERARFPGDMEFSAAFAERQVYQMNSKNKIYLLERFENYGTVEDKDIYRYIDDGDYSVEHIMPQHLTPDWIRELGEDYERIHEVWLHRLANLTLTAYNSKYSNNSFVEKRDMKNGFRESGIRMNAYIAQKGKWTLAELEERSSYLVKRALEIWAAPVTDYKPEERQLDSYTLEDEINLSGGRICRFSYKNTEQPVTSWTDMFERVLKILHAEDKSVLSKLAYTADVGVELAAYVSNKKTDLRSVLEIQDGIYIERNISTFSKLALLRRFFKLYHTDPSDRVFYMRENTESNEEEIAGTRYELRKRYWTYALEYIQKAHSDNGAFSNVHPSKGNWINGFFGIGGFNICCVANYDSARVELYLGKTNKEENKSAYDKLFLSKSDIEAALGVPLVWSRGDDIKSSKVYYQLEHVSIENEMDWFRMAKFHADWSKKFYDVIVPYLVGTF